MNYYNDNDPGACAWLRELIKAQLIPPGDVDERKIEDVRPEDLTDYIQCHFFAGIGGWAHALALAGVDPSERVWTGSCPCQPFSCAGKRKGTEDERHLWPIFAGLIDKCRPPKVFGEQVASKDGREWLAGVRIDLEGMGYAVGAADLCAASVGAPHIRQRLFWVAHSQLQQQHGGGEPRRGRGEFTDGSSGVGNSGGSGRGAQPNGVCQSALLTQSSGDSGLANSKSTGHEAFTRECFKQPTKRLTNAPAPCGWSDSIWLPCADGKARRIKSGLAPLVDGVPKRVGLLRGYGNAIVPQVTAEFIQTVNEIIS